MFPIRVGYFGDRVVRRAGIVVFGVAGGIVIVISGSFALAKEGTPASVLVGFGVAGGLLITAYFLNRLLEFDAHIGNAPRPLPRGWLANQLRRLPKQAKLDDLIVSEDRRGGYGQ